MSYLVNRSNDGFDTGWPITINDGVIDSSTSLKLLGRKTTNYGEATAENFVKLLENFANTTSPSNPITGQLWYEADPLLPGQGKLNIFNGTDWVPISQINKGTSLPTTPTEGELFYFINPGSNQFYIYHNSDWRRVGGLFSSNTAPLSSNQGDLWYDNVNDTLNVNISGNFRKLLIGDPTGNSDIKLDIAAGIGLIIFFTNSVPMVVIATGNVPFASLPSYLSSYFTNGLSPGLNLTTLGSSGIYQPNGVRILSELITTNFILEPTEDNITATGNTIATAYALTAKNNFITTTTPGADGVMLPDVKVGMTISVWNLNNTDSVNVYPHTSRSINNLAINAPYVLAPNTFVEFVGRNVNNYRSKG